VTYKVLDEGTNKVIHRSRIRLATLDPNRQIDPIDDGVMANQGQADPIEGGGATVGENIGATDDSMPDEGEENVVEFDPGGDDNTSNTTMAIIDPNDLIGRTYLTNPSEDGQRMRLKVIEILDRDDDDRMQSPLITKFRAVNGQDTYEEVVTYNQLIDHLDNDDGQDGLWKFKTISGHQGPLKPSDKENYKGSRWNVQVEWENGEVTYEPLGIIAKSDPVSLAIYARDNNLLHLDGWKQFERLA